MKGNKRKEKLLKSCLKPMKFQKFLKMLVKSLLASLMVWNMDSQVLFGKYKYC